MNIDCLADTGRNITQLVALAMMLIIVAGVGRVVFRRRLGGDKKFVAGTFMVAGLLVFGGFPLQPTATHAASGKCAPSGRSNGSTSGDTSGAIQTPASKLVLVDNTYDQHDFTSDDGGNTWQALLDILINDNAPVGDPINPNTVRLSTTDNRISDVGATYYGIPDGLYMQVYDGDTEGVIYLSGLDVGTPNWNQLTGKVYVELRNYDIESSGGLPPNLNLSLQYTAQTMSGKAATGPATITITTPPPNPIQLSTFNECGIDGITYDLLDYALTSQGILDPLTIDLDPLTPGRQTSYVYTTSYGDPLITNTISVDNSGILTLHTSREDDANLYDHDYYWTISNSLGDTSDVGTIHVQFCGG